MTTRETILLILCIVINFVWAAFAIYMNESWYKHAKKLNESWHEELIRIISLYIEGSTK